ncbi:MAG: GC-type dockerin domain-anchored protein [Planctomycetota bacterium]|nr:GC-type dockerin domain-anchored protein [Planctomycetota bacterium]
MRRSHRRPYYFLAVALLTGFVAAVAPAWGQAIEEDFKLFASDGAMGDRFGFSVAIENGIIAAGAFHDADRGQSSGSVYLFDASTGVEIAKVLPDDGGVNGQFGISLALDGGVLAVGAIGGTENGTFSGSAYLFDAATGVQLARLTPNDGGAFDLFGFSIAMDDGLVAVGAIGDDEGGDGAGAVYLFDASTGVQLAKLVANDAEDFDQFGGAVALDNGLVAIGARFDQGNGFGAGAAYLFDAASGTQLAKLLPDDGMGGATFGVSIALENGVVAVGANGDDDNGQGAGAVYLFDASTGAQFAKLLTDDGASGDQFGLAVVLDEGILAATALSHDDDTGAEIGAAYLFAVSTGTQLAKLVASERPTDDRFGITIALGEGIAAVGADLDDDPDTETGAVYVYAIGGVLCPADLTGDGVVDTQDFLLYLGAFAAGDRLADWNSDGEINTLDFLAYLGDWAAGCP